MLSCLAEIGYPPGERSLMPLLEQVYQWLLSPQHLGSVKTIAGRARRCASQEGNAVYYAPEKKYYRVSEKTQSGASCVD